MKTINVEKALNGKFMFIDVRTPKEYEESTIPGAINIPLFSNDERAVVGKLYTKKSREEAIQKGLTFVSKKLPGLIETVSKYKDKDLVIFCWRGGMRSNSLTALLDSLNFKVFQLVGGYKDYRRYILKKFEDYNLKPQLIVLYGLTGVGKTEILKQFSNSLDLEDLAQHRSSILGSVGLKPRSQKMFDSLLFKRLEELKNEKFVLIEGESRKIGKVQMPSFLFKDMKKGINIKIVDSQENRVKRLVKEYSNHKEELSEKIKLMSKVVGNDNKIKLWSDMLEEEKFEELAKILLEEYYDPLYRYTVDSVEYTSVLKSDYVNGLKKFQES